jgi:hypothetical protein
MFEAFPLPVSGLLAAKTRGAKYINRYYSGCRATQTSEVHGEQGLSNAPGFNHETWHWKPWLRLPKSWAKQLPWAIT